MSAKPMLTFRSFLGRRDPLLLLELDGTRAYARLERYLVDERWVFDWCEYAEAAQEAGGRKGAGKAQGEAGTGQPRVEEVVREIVESPDGLVGLRRRKAVSPGQLAAVFLDPQALLQVHAEVTEGANRHWRQVAKRRTARRLVARSCPPMKKKIRLAARLTSDSRVAIVSSDRRAKNCSIPSDRKSAAGRYSMIAPAKSWLTSRTNAA